jgi:hypothetical protein
MIIDDGQKWRLAVVYGEPYWKHQNRTKAYLRDPQALLKITWLVFGDFNEILFNSEKEGARLLRFMEAFHICLDECMLMDMDYIGDKFTLRRGRIKERLNRSVCNA